MFDAYLDGELSIEEYLGIAGHLEGCASCRTELQMAGRLRLSVRRAVSAVAVPAELRGRLAWLP